MENKGVFWSSRIYHLNKTLPYIRNYKRLCVWFNSRLTSFSCTWVSRLRRDLLIVIIYFGLPIDPLCKWKGDFNPLREVVSNFQESGDRSKNSIFFYLLQKTLILNCFQKWYSKFQRVFLLAKIRKFEIGQNVPNLHNFYLAFSAFSQHSYKTTKNYLGFIFL